MTRPFEKRDDIGAAKKLMGALLRQPPKLHEDMKLKKARKKAEPENTPEAPGTSPDAKR